MFRRWDKLFTINLRPGPDTGIFSYLLTQPIKLLQEPLSNTPITKPLCFLVPLPCHSFTQTELWTQGGVDCSVCASMSSWVGTEAEGNLITSSLTLGETTLRCTFQEGMPYCIIGKENWGFLHSHVRDSRPSGWDTVWQFSLVQVLPSSGTREPQRCYFRRCCSVAVRV